MPHLTRLPCLSYIPASLVLRPGKPIPTNATY